ncbi:MAG: pantoate--beta-alanine ligase [Chloroflexota bacterium]|nr:MAG: pantoate--beta-alanine ligase [Chloroflexota bacterium]
MQGQSKPKPRILTTLAELRVARRAMPGLVGVVPTMGFLHEGHASLMRRARTECATVVATNFVNPAQFGPREDFSRYPRDMDADTRLCEREGVDYVYAPSVDTVYPSGFATTVDVAGVSARWEGEYRPGHFHGVATVVAKLLIATGANRAYFGEKDFQQLQVVRRLAIDLDLPVEIVACPTVREADGLARSSRNVYLTDDDRRRALSISQALFAARDACKAGERRAAKLGESVRSLVTDAGLAIDYVAVVDRDTLEPIEVFDRAGRILIAARVGSTRLIDNIGLEC